MQVPSPNPNHASAWRVRADRIAPLLLATIPVAYFALAVFGVVRAYSAVPFWDMWDHYVMPVSALRQGNWVYYFFHQANEHRIPLSEMLFAIDIFAFGGSARFLFVSNLALMVLTWVVLAAMARHLLRGYGNLWVLVALGLAAPAFSWLHEANLTWAYQSQFFLAYLVPLAAYACLARALESPKATAWFVGALALGVASLGTMANGVLAMPIMVVMWLLGPQQNRPRLALICGLGTLATAAWFSGYYAIPRPAAGLTDVLIFFDTFFGAPVQDVTQNETWGIIAGIIFIAASVACAVQWWRHRATQSPMLLAVLAFLAFCGASAAVVAVGRAGLHHNAAVSTRYATPSLLAWCGLAVAIVFIFRTARFVRVGTISCAVVVAAFLFSVQISVSSDGIPAAGQKKDVGGLALKMEIFDTETIPRVYPLDNPAQIELIKRASAKAVETQISIFGDPVWDAAVAAIGTPADRGFHACLGFAEGTSAIADEDRYRRVSGWAYDNAAKRVPPFAHLAADGTIVGVAITGAPRPDVRQEYGRRARLSGFNGYVKTPANTPLSVVCAD